ncbi:hypothetical protein ISCGN_015176 [Ixodes scapularis]
MSRTGLKDKDKYESNNSRRTHSIMCPEDLAAGKKSHWPELEITGIIRNLSPALWRLSHLTCLYLNDNSLSRLPPGIGRLSGLQHLDLSCNKLRSLPAELGDLVLLQQLLLSHNYLRVLPYEIGKLFRLQVLGLKGNPLAPEILNVYSEPNGTSKLLAYLLDNLVGIIRNLSPALWRLSHLTCLYLNDNSLSRLPPGIGRLSGLQHLDLSCNKLRSLPAELGDLVLLQQLLLSHNYLRVLPYEIGKLFRLQVLGLKGNPLAPEILNVYSEPNGTSKLLAYLLDNLVVCANKRLPRGRTAEMDSSLFDTPAR